MGIFRKRSFTVCKRTLLGKRYWLKLEVEVWLDAAGLVPAFRAGVLRSKQARSKAGC